MFLQNIQSESPKHGGGSSNIPLFIELTIYNKKGIVSPLQGVIVDAWHCDKDGYCAGTLSFNSDNKNGLFSRNRQTTNKNGQVFFKSSFSHSYPHIHLEILTETGKLLLVTQIAFPENFNSNVYASVLYAADGQPDNSHNDDAIFTDNMNENLAMVSGNLINGITVKKTLSVSL
jgi:protocatechuate 3,4-dioxygenase beta subunit